MKNKIKQLFSQGKFVTLFIATVLILALVIMGVQSKARRASNGELAGNLQIILSSPNKLADTSKQTIDTQNTDSLTIKEPSTSEETTTRTITTEEASMPTPDLQVVYDPNNDPIVNPLLEGENEAEFMGQSEADFEGEAPSEADFLQNTFPLKADSLVYLNGSLDPIKMRMGDNAFITVNQDITEPLLVKLQSLDKTEEYALLDGVPDGPIQFHANSVMSGMYRVSVEDKNTNIKLLSPLIEVIGFVDPNKATITVNGQTEGEINLAPGQEVVLVTDQSKPYITEGTLVTMEKVSGEDSLPSSITVYQSKNRIIHFFVPAQAVGGSYRMSVMGENSKSIAPSQVLLKIGEK